MILDLDNFKQVNDSFGHSSGDFILKSIGEGLKDVLYVRNVEFIDENIESLEV